MSGEDASRDLFGVLGKRPLVKARVVCLADVAPETVSWLWPGRIPIGKLTVLMGDPGLGKSMLSLSIASRVTRGAAFPDGAAAPKGDVVILTAEDGLGDTIRPRLDQFGADVSRVHALEGIAEELTDGEHHFSLVRDLEALEDVVSETGAKLIILDPLDAYTMGVDSYKNADMRSMLAPFARMLERHQAAGVVIHHLNKGDGSQKALYRAGGSLALVAAARSVLGVSPDPDNDGRNLFLSVKCNLAAPTAGMGYRISDRGIEWDADPVVTSVESAFAGRRQVDSGTMAAAKTFLAEALADGTFRPSAEVEAEAADAGVGRTTLANARKKLRVEVKKEGFGAGAAWYWRMPTDDEGAA